MNTLPARLSEAAVIRRYLHGPRDRAALMLEAAACRINAGDVTR